MTVTRGLLLFCFIYCSRRSSAEQVLHLSKPDSYPHYGQPYTIDCNVTSYARYQSITFKRNREEICQIYIDVINNKTVCLNNQNDTADYQCSCVGFYDNKRLYSVRITSVKLVDATKWTCVSIHYFQHSNAIFLNYGPDSAAITGNQLQFPADGANTLRLNCTTSVTNSQVIFTWISINSTSKARTLTTTGAIVSHSTSAGFTYSQELMIAPRWYQDADNIICSVRNKNVSSFIPVTTSVNLDLLYGPEKVTIRGSQPRFIADGVNTLTLICKTSITKGLVAFKWINATSTEQITTNVGSIETQNVGRGFTFSQSMQITPAWYMDEDMIKCEVTNTNISGSNPVTNSVTLDLIYGPENVTISGNQPRFIANGVKTLTLVCKTSITKGQVAFKWINATSTEQITTNVGSIETQNDDRGSTFSESLQITPVWYQDGDVIKCEVTNTEIPNSNPVITSSNLDLIYGPEEVTISGSQPGFIADGINTLTLICKTSVTKGQVAFKWINATSTEQMTTSVGSIETQNVDRGSTFSQSLQITPAWYQDGDVIKCEVTNTEIPNANPVITSINLDLLFAPISVPEINGYTSGTPFREGDFLNISCQVTGGKPLVSNIKLVCDGADSTSIQIEEHDTVIKYTWFRVLRILHDKVCGCSAVHVTDKYKLASVVTLFVNYAPSVTLRTEFRRQTRSVRLICEARGRPAVFHFSRFTHSWRGRGIRELTGELEPPHKYVLTIQPYRYSDSGSYQCAVSNDIIGLNNVTQQLGSIAVNMEVQPALVNATKQNETIQANIGDILVLNKTIFSRADIISYRWINQGRKIMKSRISTTDVILNIYTTKVMDVAYVVALVIERFGENHVGLYVLRVCNKFGCAQFYTHVEVAGRPLPAVSGLLLPILLGIAGVLILIIIIVAVVVICGAKRRRERNPNKNENNEEYNHVNVENSKKQERQGNSMYPPPPLESQPRLKTRPVFKDLRQFMRRPGRPKKTTASTSDGELPTPTTIEEEHNFSPDVSSDFTDHSSGYQGSGAKFSSQELKEVEEINAVNAVEEMTGVNHVSDVNAAEDINFMRDMNDIYAVVKRKRKNPNRYRCTDGNFHDSTTVHESEESENEQSDDVRTSVL